MVRSKAFGRSLFAAMCLLGAGLIWESWRDVTAARGRLGAIGIGMTPDQVRQALGQPSEVSGPVWNYSQAGRTTTIRFEPGSNEVAAISCREQDRTSPACPDLLGVRVGKGDAQLRQLLGTGRKTGSAGHLGLAFDPIGATFELSDGKVSAISLGPVAEQNSVWPIVLWRLMP